MLIILKQTITKSNNGKIHGKKEGNQKDRLGLALMQFFGSPGRDDLVTQSRPRRSGYAKLVETTWLPSSLGLH